MYHFQNINNSNFSGITIRKILKKLIAENITKGENIKKFETEFGKYIGLKHAISTSSARLALYLILKSVKINKQVDEIILPAIIPAIVIKICEICGLKPIIADIESKILNINPVEIEKKYLRMQNFF